MIAVSGSFSGTNWLYEGMLPYSLCCAKGDMGKSLNIFQGSFWDTKQNNGA